MHPVLFIQSAADGVLLVNGVFCGPVGEGQSFPAGRDAEVYIQLFPFGEMPPLTAGLRLVGGRIAQLYPRESAFALCWPDGVIQIELHSAMQPAQEGKREEGEPAAAGVLLRYLEGRLAGDLQAQVLLMRPQDAPELPRYEAALPLRFAPLHADPRCDERAGLMRRVAENVAVVDAALAMTVPVGQGRKRIERIEIIRTDG